MDVNEKVAALRGAMEKNGVDIYMVTTEDAYLAESACDYWRALRWLTDFSGTLAYALLTRDKLAFFTDARYIVTVRNQMRIQGAELYDVTEVGAERYLKWIAGELSALKKDNSLFGVDGRTLTTARMESIALTLKAIPGAAMKCDMDLIGQVWPGRPAPAYKAIFDHPLKYSGRGRAEKAADVRAEMKSRGCDHYVVGTMEGVVWLTNMRGRDIINPLFMSHALFTPESVKLFAKTPMIPENLQKDLIASGYELHDIDAAAEEIGKIPEGSTVFYDIFRTNSLLSSSIPANARVIRGFDIVNDLKAIKNETEIENLRSTNKIEAAALTRIMKFLKERISDGGYSEYDLDAVLEEFHRRSPEFLCNGNDPTMFAYMANGAKPHYNPKPETAVKVRPEGVIVMDVLSHYYGGTTDLTRTVWLGPSRYDEEIRRDYTLTLKSMMALSRQIFREGTDGAYLDSVARCVLWNDRSHYGYGTGHGIGYCICAHEGPQFIAEPSYKKEWAFCYLPLKPGMVMANEPGVYKVDRYGIRLENNLVVTEDCVNEFGRWYKFETLSYCPFEPSLIDASMLSGAELEWLNRYNAKTREDLSPYLDDEEREWLSKMTAPLPQ
jgi:Xaa-Pro aminopeptidase